MCPPPAQCSGTGMGSHDGCYPCDGQDADTEQPWKTCCAQGGLCSHLCQPHTRVASAGRVSSSAVTISIQETFTIKIYSHLGKIIQSQEHSRLPALCQAPRGLPGTLNKQDVGCSQLTSELQRGNECSNQRDLPTPATPVHTPEGPPL